MKEFSDKVIQWYSKNKRALPWRQNPSPYKTWLSEIILQQTRIAQGLGYYTNIINKYETIQDLAAGKESEVLKLWQGLGYYNRARNMHFTARYLVEKNRGHFPNTYEELIKLKGVGRYTAAAIASICFDEPIPVIDGNVYRVISRCFLIDIPIPSNRAYHYFKGRLAELMDARRPGDFNQGVMELGALICIPKNPHCKQCPLRDHCAARRENRIAAYPFKAEKKRRSNRYFNFLLIRCDGELLMLRRNQKDIWAKLYTFPLIECKTPQAKRRLKEALQVEDIQLLGKTLHALTHQNLHIKFWSIDPGPTTYKRLQTHFGATSIPARETGTYAVPKPVENFLNQVFSTNFCTFDRKAST